MKTNLHKSLVSTIHSYLQINETMMNMDFEIVLSLHEAQFESELTDFMDDMIGNRWTILICGEYL